jgi:tagaturonate reductase
MSIGKYIPPLRLGINSQDERRKIENIRQLPIKILQIGAGNFLRGFFDWMIYESIAQGKYHGSIALTPPTPNGAVKLNELAQQDGLYTLITRGFQHGEVIEQKSIIPVFKTLIDPYTEWEQFLKLAELESLDVIISNTTEAGLTYEPINYIAGEPIRNYPARLTVFLHRRFQHFAGDLGHGLLILPCELLQNNGDLLKQYVLRYAREFGFGEEFVTWIEQSQRFLNNLVDRIVPGMPPEEERQRLTGQYGYEDQFMNTAEPYHLWAIQAEPALDKRLPLAQIGLNVHWVNDLKPFQERKVRILNGAHTLMTPVGLLYGQKTVRDVMQDTVLGDWITSTITEEVIPALTLEEKELHAYAVETFERFRNPYLEHRLQDIALNSLSKFKTRLLPTLKAYSEKYNDLPAEIVYSFSALLLLYRLQPVGDGKYEAQTLAGLSIPIQDNPSYIDHLIEHWQQSELSHVITSILSDQHIWDEDLTLIQGLAEAITANIRTLEEQRQ